jgi:hypothetical protein
VDGSVGDMEMDTGYSNDSQLLEVGGILYGAYRCSAYYSTLGMGLIAYLDGSCIA